MFGSVPVHLVADIGHSVHIYTHYTYIHTYTERDSKYLVRAYECLCRIYIYDVVTLHYCSFLLSIVSPDPIVHKQRP